MLMSSVYVVWLMVWDVSSICGVVGGMGGISSVCMWCRICAVYTVWWVVWGVCSTCGVVGGLGCVKCMWCVEWYGKCELNSICKICTIDQGNPT